ncbi:unnamed protein product [Brassicogethes aeneus]|uniref:CRAL-TRIO domain-containing protein n=1 Tax=Brassicogethes aeneus TaxID=1431903 RepID=A0A9P0ASN8_BRAAE|nr:unnamed protein product [Brassicogethes aeneus]
MADKIIDVDTILKNDPNIKQEDIKSMREWLEKQPHLPEITDLQIILFLQCCYYRNEAAKIALDNCFTIKTLCPDIFANRDANHKDLNLALNTTLVTTMPKKTPEGYCVVYTRLVDCNSDNFVLSSHIKYMDMVATHHLCTEGPCKGLVIINDMEGAVVGHLTKVNIIVAKKLMYYLQEAMPVRLKGIHLINVVSWVDKLVAMLKPFMKKELFELLCIHPKVDDALLKVVFKECLPKELGGTETIAALHEKIKKAIHNNTELFKKEEMQKVDETKRPGKAKNVGEIFGIEGTFKKLEVD